MPAELQKHAPLSPRVPPCSKVELVGEFSVSRVVGCRLVPISRVVFSCSFSRVLQECLNCLLQVAADLDALSLCPVVLLFEASDGEGPEVQPGCLLANVSPIIKQGSASQMHCPAALAPSACSFSDAEGIAELAPEGQALQCPHHLLFPFCKGIAAHNHLMPQAKQLLNGFNVLVWDVAIDFQHIVKVNHDFGLGL